MQDSLSRKESGPTATIPSSKSPWGSVFFFLSPLLLGFLLFVLFPILFSLYISFTNWSLKPAIAVEWTGLQNFTRLLGFRTVDPGVTFTSLLALFSAAFAILVQLAGLFTIIISMKDQWRGQQTAGGLMLVSGLAMIGAGFYTGSVDWALYGILLVFASFLTILGDETGRIGPAIFGPIILLAGALSFSIAWGPFNVHWSPLDPNFYRYLYNTFYLMIAVPVQIAGSLALALMLSKPFNFGSKFQRLLLAGIFFALAAIGGATILLFNADAAILWFSFWAIAGFGPIFGITAFRTLFYIPTFTAGVAVMLLWKQVFNPDFGLLNEVIRAVTFFSIPGELLPRWLLDPDWAKPALILMNLWLFVGGANMLLYLAGLANIPPALYEAADIDGANRWQRFQNITWPQLAPTTFFIIVMTTIAGLQGGFEQARVMTAGGPAGSTKTLAYYIYEKAFEELALGYASAIAWVLFVIIFGLTLMNWKFGNQNVND